MRSALALALLASALASAAPFDVMEIASPAAPRSTAPAIAVAPDRTIWLSWVEPGAGAVASGQHHGSAASPQTGASLRYSTYDARSKAWREPRTIASDNTVTTSAADFPQLVVDGRGTAHALWTDGRGGAFVSHSSVGQTWTKPTPWSRTSAEVEKFSLVRLEDGRVLVAWLDGRAHAKTIAPQQLLARLIDAPESSDHLIDASVCDCCQTSLAALMDGGAVVAYRGRSPNEVRDVMTARLRTSGWDEPRRVNNDDWMINGCPVNGPRITADRSHAAVAWFTAAEQEPKVLATYSPDAGARWLMPLRIDRGNPVGHVDTLLLRDGAILVSWLETDGALWLRRINPDFAATEPVQLVSAGGASARGFPRMVLLEDYAGESSNARVLVTYTAEGQSAGVRTLLITVPEGELLARERACNCAPTAEQLQSIPVRGRIVAAEPETNTIRVTHGEIAGVLSAGTHAFRVAPLLLATVRSDADFIGRIDRHEDGTWWLNEIRLLNQALP